MAAEQKPASKRQSATEKPKDAPTAEEQAAEDEEAQKRSEAAEKAAATEAENAARKDAAALLLYGHLRHTLGAEVGIEHARQIVEMVETALTPPASPDEGE